MEIISAYEQERNKNIARNRAFLASLGLGEIPVAAGDVLVAPEAAVTEAPGEPDTRHVLRSLTARWPGRHRELEALLTAIRSPGDVPVLVTGPSASGKTSLACAVVKAAYPVHAIVECESATGTNAAARLFERAGRVLRGGCGHTCRDAPAFARVLDSISDRICILVDRCELALGGAYCSNVAPSASPGTLEIFLAATRYARRTATRIVFVGADRQMASCCVRILEPSLSCFMPMLSCAQQHQS